MRRVTFFLFTSLWILEGSDRDLLLHHSWSGWLHSDITITWMVLEHHSSRCSLHLSAAQLLPRDSDSIWMLPFTVLCLSGNCPCCCWHQYVLMTSGPSKLVPESGRSRWGSSINNFTNPSTDFPPHLIHSGLDQHLGSPRTLPLAMKCSWKVHLWAVQPHCLMLSI